MNISDTRFKYTNSHNTNILTTLKRHGFTPTTPAEREARQRRAQEHRDAPQDQLAQRRAAAQKG